MARNTCLAVVLLSIFALSFQAQASHLSPKQGRTFVGVGIGVQVVGLSLALVSDQVGGLATSIRISYELVTPAFAPMTIAGFEAAFTDGTPRGRERALAMGFLEGALYSGVMAVLCPIGLFVPSVFYRGPPLQGGIQPRSTPPYDVFVRMGVYIVTSLGLLMPGIALMERSRQAPADPDSSYRFDHRLTVHVTPGGLSLAARF